MRHNNLVTLFAAFTAALLLMLSMSSLAGTENQDGPRIDLTQTQDGQELIGVMLGIPGHQGVANLDDARKSTHWIQPNESALAAPRQRSTIWLKASLHNGSKQALIRWLVLEPWRMKRVNAFFIDPATGETLQQTTTGLDVPVEKRAISNGKTIIPVQLSAGETRQLIVEIQSESLPSVSLKSWEPVAYTQTLNSDRMFQVALLAGILTLLVVLIFQFNASLIITGLWLLVAFIFETEKNGFFSFYLFGALENYAINLRVSAWVFTEQLFLTTSLVLLNLQSRPFWRNFLIATSISALLMSALTFVLNGSDIRNLGIVITGLYAICWLFMIPDALRSGGKKQLPVLILLSIYWAVSTFLLLGYTFNFYYTSTFAAARIYIEILIALALILTYSWQQKRQLYAAEQQLRKRELMSRKALENAVKQRTDALNTALESAQKANTAKVNFLGRVTHDLRSPLTAILGYAQLQSAGAVSSQKTSQVIQDRASYMKDLIDGLVDYARGLTAGTDELRTVYLIAFIDTLVNQAHVMAGKRNNRVQLKVETELPTVIQCNSTKLQRIVLNLLDNAAKYTENGEIVLSVSLNNPENAEPTLSFEVADTGDGITPQQLEQIHTPFYQSSEANPGAGLGIPICIELAESMGGTLSLASQPGEGTSATCTIPYTAGDEQLVTATHPATRDLLPVFDAENRKAWVVEDSPHICELLDNELTDMGFQVELSDSAEDFSEAMRREENTEAPCIIITDYQLPGATGADVLRTARHFWPEVPVVLLSGTHHSNPEPLDTFSDRFDAYLSKPIDLHQLRLKLAELCDLTSESLSAQASDL